MATTLISIQEFATSPYADIADQVDNIESVIKQAEAHIQRKLDRTLANTVYTEIHTPRQYKIFLDQRPVTELTSISKRLTYNGSWTLADLGDFRLNANAGVITDLAGSIAGYEVQVVYKAGFATIPDDIKSATILQTVLLAFQDYEVFGAGDGKEPAINHFQTQIDELLWPYRKATLL